MSSRRPLDLLFWTTVVAVAILLVSPVVFHAAPQNSGYHVIRTVLLGGDGSWDYLTVDPDAKRIYIPRSNDIMVVDEVSGKVAGDISGLGGLHAFQVYAPTNRGYATGNEGTPPAPVIYVIDLKTLQVTDKIKPDPSAKGNDSEEYDALTKRIFAYTAQTNNVQAIDAATGKIVGTVTFPGRPEGSMSDGKGSMFVNIVDKSEVVEFDTKTLAIKNTWSSAPCVRGVGMAIDRVHRRLLLSCSGTTNDGKTRMGTDLAVVMNADTGKVVATMPIGMATDGAAFDPGTGALFITTRDRGDGKNSATYIFHEDSPDKYTKVGEVPTIYGARTISLDPKTHHVFTITTAQNDPVPPTADNPNPRPKPVPSTFTLVEIGK